jgi:3-methyl-2-oxobutanoate hydroxymethyltransferase
MPEDRITIDRIRVWGEGRPILAVTAYDYTVARLLDEAGVDILHVGDSLGMIMLGHEDTTRVTMEDMLRATEAVSRGTQHALITADLPIHSYDTPEMATRNASRLIDAGADAVKMEGGREIIDQSRAVRENRIPIQGHLGMLPQQILQEGAYKKKGKKVEEVEKMKEDARLLQEVGAFSIVLESVVPEVAGQITRELDIPTIGIASGEKTTGQIRVYSDVIGLTPWFNFPHVKPQARVSVAIAEAIEKLKSELESAPE